MSGLVTIRAFRESDRFVVAHYTGSPASRYPRYTPTSPRLFRVSSPSGLSGSRTGLLSLIVWYNQRHVSPIYAHFSETVSGLVTIRAFRGSDRFVVNGCKVTLYPWYMPTSPRLCPASSPSGLSESQTGLLSLFVPRFRESAGILNLIRLSVPLSICLSVTKILTLALFFALLQVELWYLACVFFVTRPFRWYHVVTLTVTFDLLQGQICCRAGDHNSLNLLVVIKLSQIYAHFSETVSGLVTIRAFRESDRFVVHVCCHRYFHYSPTSPRLCPASSPSGLSESLKVLLSLVVWYHNIMLSQIYAHFSETVSGLVIIRAFREFNSFVVITVKHILWRGYHAEYVKLLFRD